MKTIHLLKACKVTFIVILSIVGRTSAQESNQNARIIGFSELSSIIDQKYANPDQSKGMGCMWIASANFFPINGCHTFDVEQTFNYGIGSTTVSSTVRICCVCGVCAPMGRLAAGPNGTIPRTVSINASSSVPFDRYTLSIAKGSYQTDTEGNILNLKYLVIEK